MRRTLLVLIVVALAVMTTSRSLAGVIPLKFVVDEQASFIRIDGEVLDIPIKGDQQTAVGGTISVRALVNGSRPVGFIIDDSLFSQLDPINLKVPNPIPFLPPLAEFSVTDLSLALTTGGVRFGPGLSFFTDTGRIEILSGMAEGDILGDPIGPLDLSGNIQENVPVEGAMKVVGDQVRIEFPISQDIVIPDVPGTFQLTGRVVAYAPIP